MNKDSKNLENRKNSEKQLELTQEKEKLQKILSKKIKKVEKKEASILENLKECAQWERFQHEGDLIKANLNVLKNAPKGSSSIFVHDWMSDQPYEIVFQVEKTIKTPQEEMAFRYRRAKKLLAGKEPLSQYLVKLQEELSVLKQVEVKLSLITTLEELIQFRETACHHLMTPLAPLKNRCSPFSSASSHLKSLSKEERSLPIYKEYQSAQGCKIWVGKSAKKNDQLTFHLANGRDWWLHVRGCSGSHVIIKTNKEQEPDEETLKDAFQLALYHSKGRMQGEGEICFTQRKYVSRLGQKKAGLVQISKHQTAWVRFDPNRLKALQERS